MVAVLFDSVIVSPKTMVSIFSSVTSPPQLGAFKQSGRMFAIEARQVLSSYSFFDSMAANPTEQNNFCMGKIPIQDSLLGQSSKMSESVQLKFLRPNCLK